VVIDAHHHLWDRARGYQWLDDPALRPLRRSFGIDDLRAEVGPAGVDKTVLVEAGRCTPEEVLEFLSIADAAPDIVGVVGWVDLTDPALAETVAAYRKRPDGRWLVGVRAQVQREGALDYLRRADVRRGLEAVARGGLAYDLVVRVDQLPACVEAARAVPDLTLVLDHAGKPRIRAGWAGLEEWRELVAPLAACPNVVCKLSGLVTEADHETWTPADLRPFVETALELFGAERALFGSDWPVCLLAASYGQVKEALEAALPPLSDTERAQVFGGNAVRVYGLEVA
jgi:L-fuconolactonase